MPYIIKNIILEPNEQFVLPPGASIIATSDAEAIESSCVDLTGVEDYECYVAVIGSSSADDLYWIAETTRFTGVRLNNTNYTFPSPIEASNSKCFDGNEIAIAVKNAIGGVIATAGSNNTPSLGANCQTFVLLKTISSIGDSLQLLAESTLAALGVTGESKVNSKIDFIKLSAATTQGYNHNLTCPS